MGLSELFKAVRKLEPEAIRQRDHICSEPARHDLAHCPKPAGAQYAWLTAGGGELKGVGRAWRGGRSTGAREFAGACRSGAKRRGR